jgi:hypothetical protein
MFILIIIQIRSQLRVYLITHKKKSKYGKKKVILWFKINEASLCSLSTTIVIIEFHFK